MFVQTWFGMEVYHHGHYYKATVPGFYTDTTTGLCSTNDGDMSNDYITKDGVKWPMPEQRGWRMSEA